MHIRKEETPKPVQGIVSVNNLPAIWPVSDNGGSITVDGTVGISGVVPVTNTLTSGTNARISVFGLTPLEVKVGASRFANRKVVMFTAMDSGLYWGFTPSVSASNGTPIPKHSSVVLDVGNVGVYVVGDTALVRSIAVIEAA